MIKIALLGSTGSIGVQTLNIALRHRGEFEIVSLAATVMQHAVRLFGIVFQSFDLIERYSALNLVDRNFNHTHNSLFL